MILLFWQAVHKVVFNVNVFKEKLQICLRKTHDSDSVNEKWTAYH